MLGIYANRVNIGVGFSGKRKKYISVRVPKNATPKDKKEAILKTLLQLGIDLNSPEIGNIKLVYS